ncbi:helix-turn-helix domain-containing protein [Blautia sp. NSJ-175]|uniref:PucR family transcriptional regulator n=1 Tax=Blautia sp. NSJ-175 TaxID=2931396 RepID=UPI001FD57714|nr:helix-turn-helix domain-containing protein [Blautia sp. NSJ-175]
MKEKLVKYKLNSSVSYRFPDIINIYEQAYLTTAAIRLGTRIDREKYFYPYSKYRIIHIMDILAEKIDLKLLCNPEILHLHENDKDGILMQSFYVYMKENMSLSKAAEILNIHKSTLGYRLLKVERMVTLNLNDSDVRQSILLSCEILQYLNTYK